MFYDRVFRDYSRPVLVISDSEMNQLKIDQIKRTNMLLEERLNSYTVAIEEVKDKLEKNKQAILALSPSKPNESLEAGAKAPETTDWSGPCYYKQAGRKNPQESSQSRGKTGQGLCRVTPAVAPFVLNQITEWHLTKQELLLVK